VTLLKNDASRRWLGLNVTHTGLGKITAVGMKILPALHPGSKFDLKKN